MYIHIYLYMYTYIYICIYILYKKMKSYSYIFFIFYPCMCLFLCTYLYYWPAFGGRAFLVSIYLCIKLLIYQSMNILGPRSPSLLAYSGDQAFAVPGPALPTWPAGARVPCTAGVGPVRSSSLARGSFAARVAFSYATSSTNTKTNFVFSPNITFYNGFWRT